MTNLYQKFRRELTTDGVDPTAEGATSTRGGRIAGIALLALTAWFAVRSPWTLLFIVGLLLSVFLHEVGHYSTARLTGMKATQFFMGFGPRVWSRTRGETEFGVRALPLGAFVRIIGMSSLDEVDPADENRTYRSKSYPRRLLVITAGSLMHMVIAFVLMFGVFVTGGREQQTGRAVIRGLDATHGPAHVVGLAKGDVVVSIGGRPVTTYETVSASVRVFEPGDTVDVVYERDGVRRTVQARLEPHPMVKDRAYLGIWADDWGWKRLSPVVAAGRAVGDIGKTIADSARGVVVALNPMNSIRHLTNDQASVSTRPTTVVGVSQAGGSVGRSDGLKGVLMLLAGVNVFVGVFNMFPLLPFDGGHAAIATYERLRSRRGRRYQADITKMVPVATAVVGLLSILLLTGLYLDITQPLK